MPNYLDRARDRLAGSLDRTSERRIDIAAGRRDRLGRKTARWYAEEKALRKLEKKSRERKSERHEDKDGGESEMPLRREARTLEKHVRFVDDEEPWQSFHHRKMKVMDHHKPYRKAVAPRKILKATKSDVVKEDYNMQKDNEIDEAADVDRIMVEEGYPFRKSREFNQHTEFGRAVQEEDLENYKETTRKLKDRLSVIEGKEPMLDGEPFPQDDMQAAADALILGDIEAALPVLQYPGPKKPPKVPLDSASGLRGGGGKRSGRRGYNEDSYSRDEVNYEEYEEVYDNGVEDDDNSNMKDNARIHGKDRRETLRRYHSHRHSRQENLDHRHQYLNANHKPEGLFAAGYLQHKFADISNDQNHLARDPSNASRNSPLLAHRNTSSGSPASGFVDYSAHYKPSTAKFVDYDIRREAQGQRFGFLSCGFSHDRRQGPMLGGFATSKLPGNRYFADGFSTVNDHSFDTLNQSRSQPHQRQSESRGGFPKWSKSSPMSFQRDSEDEACPSDSRKRSRNKRKSSGRSDGPLPKSSQRRSEKANDNGAKHRRNGEKFSQRSQGSSSTPSRRYFERSDYRRNRRYVFVETDSSSSSDSSDSGSDSDSDSSGSDSSGSYLSDPYLPDENSHHDDDVDYKNRPPDHYATLGINRKCSQRESVPQLSSLKSYSQ